PVARAASRSSRWRRTKKRKRPPLNSISSRWAAEASPSTKRVPTRRGGWAGAAAADLAATGAADAASLAGNAMKAWTKGDRVVQPTYGAGTLVEVNEHHTVIDFDEHGRRVFATLLVVLQPTNEPAPAKAARKRATKAKPKDKEAKAEKEAK